MNENQKDKRKVRPERFTWTKDEVNALEIYSSLDDLKKKAKETGKKLILLGDKDD